MELLTTKDGKEVWFHQMERPFVFEPPFPGHRYVAIVFSNDEAATAIEQQSVARALFASGCRYGVFAGHACGAWEFALDTACIESDPDYKPSDEAFTMTTSHEGDPVEDVISFGLMCTSLDSHHFDRFLILFVGPRTGLRGAVERAILSLWHGKTPQNHNDEHRQLLGRKIAAAAQGILSGEVGLIAGARQLCALGHQAGADRDPEFLFFTGVDSESDHLPIGEVRQRWNAEALRTKDAELADYEARLRDRAFEVCRSLIQKYEHSA